MSVAKDWAQAYTDGADIHALADAEWAKVAKVHPAPTWRERVFTAAALQHKQFPPITYVVDGLIPDGLSMLVGRPKVGKSWMALDIALAVASSDGTCLAGRKVAHGNVLYCACEDSERRLQSRITKLIGAYKTVWPNDLQLATGWERLDKGGVGDIAEWIKSVRRPRLVILDTLASVKPQRTTHGYHEDYAALAELHRLANNVGIAVLILHHQRKSEAEDPLDTISGTLGLAGCVDTPIILAGTSQGMTLYVRGRDVEEAEHAITFDKPTCRWSILGNTAAVRMSDTRKAILKVLEEASEPLGPQEIADIAGLNAEVVRNRLANMVQANEVRKLTRGQYAHPSKKFAHPERPHS
jgi:RecA-family ATPase